MPCCRECGTDYTELLPWCPNCGAMDEDEFNEWEVELMGDDDLVVVFDAPNEIQALLYRTMLEEAGIHVIERPLEAEWFEGVMQRGLHSQLLAHESDAPEAMRLIQSFRDEAESGELSAEIPEESTSSTDDVNGTPAT